jgi:hypothetical protein
MFLEKYIFRSRYIFTDGWNSFYHLMFGIFAYYDILIIFFFICYQFIDIHDKNLLVDIIEFFIGYIFIILLHILYYKYAFINDSGE